jgi:putative FmdB family regulatory protein
MPTYEYECTVCGLHFERFQHMSDEPIQICPKCEGQVRRVFHAAMVIYKGKGFYSTDNHQVSGGASRSDKTEKSTENTSSNNGTQAGASASKSKD